MELNPLIRWARLISSTAPCLPLATWAMFVKVLMR